MIIRKQPVISWLLDETFTDIDKIGAPPTSNINTFRYLLNGINFLGKIRSFKPCWGLPELLMPSFEEVMTKSAKSFVKIYSQLFQEFSDDNVCGILLSKDIGTLVYGFGDNRLYIWAFTDYEDTNSLVLFFYVESTPENQRKIFSYPDLAKDEALFNTSHFKQNSIYEILANKILIYLAVKRYAKVETQIIAPKSITSLELDDTVTPYKTKNKIRNDSVQEVIIMDSRWFRRIINNNDIFVRGFFRMQNKKNAFGEWYKELIFVDSFVRHGYHRNAKIVGEKEEKDE